LYDEEGVRLQTIRYGRMPESKKVTLQRQLETEMIRVWLKIVGACIFTPPPVLLG
jgi:hypothetical protein